MKAGEFFIILMIVGCVLVTGCVLKPTNNETLVQTLSPTTTPPAAMKTTTVIPTAVPVLSNIPEGVPFGQLKVSVGNYNAILPVFVDNMSAGQVSAGKMLNLTVTEGRHTVRVCSGSVCETIDVSILSATTTTVDFEERLNRDFPLGSLNVSIGDFNANLPVSIDNLSAGNVSRGKPLIRMVSQGHHSVKICTIDNCFTEDVEVRLPNQTVVNFESRLKREGLLADLMVSIGGYNAQKLPVFLDDTSAGYVSQGTPLTLQVNTGVHEVKVCSGKYCSQEQVEVKFGKMNFIDFEEQLKTNAEYLEPTVHIVDYNLNGNSLMIHAEFINPASEDLTMTATFSCVYSYKDNPTKTRMSSSAQGQLVQSVRAGNRVISATSMYLAGGTDIMVSEPVVLTLTTR